MRKIFDAHLKRVVWDIKRFPTRLYPFVLRTSPVLIGQLQSIQEWRSTVHATLPRIEAFLARHTPPFIAKVYRPTPAQSERRRDVLGRIELWYPR